MRISLICRSLSSISFCLASISLRWASISLCLGFDLPLFGLNGGAQVLIFSF